MCDSRYDRTVPLPVQLEQLLHNCSGWVDAVEVIVAQVPAGTPDGKHARRHLLVAGEDLAAARHHALQAFRRFVAAQPPDVPPGLTNAEILDLDPPDRGP